MNESYINCQQENICTFYKVDAHVQASFLALNHLQAGPSPVGMSP